MSLMIEISQFEHYTQRHENKREHMGVLFFLSSVTLPPDPDKTMGAFGLPHACKLCDCPWLRLMQYVSCQSV
jgi:hypothetical protein